MIWALLALWLFGSGGGSNLTAFYEPAKTFIKADIQDSARRAELLAIVDEAEKTTQEQLKARGKVVKELASISAGHQSKSSDIRPVLERLNAESDVFQERMIRHRFGLKAKMTCEEWANAFPAEEPKPAKK